MKICRNEITDYSYANFTEDEPEWLAENTYNVGEEARDDHYIYKYAGVNGENTETKPSLNPTVWFKNRTSNYYAMLGSKTSEQTKVNGDLIIEIDILNYDTFAVLNIIGSSLEVELTNLSTGEVVYTDEYNLQNTQDIIDAYSHYFSPFDFFNMYYSNLPIYTSARLRLTVKALNGISAIGRLISGQSYYVGSTLFQARQSLESYSTQTIDQFGTADLQQVGAVFNASYEISIPSTKVGSIKRKRKEFDAIPILFIADEEKDSKFENLLSYGLWQNAELLISNPTNSDMSMTVKELL